MSDPNQPLDPATVRSLIAMKRRGVTLGLERMRGFVAALGNPERRVPVVHVAGTNGKGSVAAMLEAIFRTAGWRTGLYTSPHLVRLGERIQVNRVPLAAGELAGLVAELKAVVERRVAEAGEDARPTYFEFMTALAFVRFARSSCDVAIVEVGMGGRLDATNVVVPEVAAITSIGLDHCEFLGNTLGAIAGEKAGIVKPARPVVIGQLPAEAERVVRAVASRENAPLNSVRDVFGESLADYPQTNLAGDYQRVNAATATLVARAMPPRLRPDDATIARALLAIEWPARWQRLQIGERTVILDTSHNVEGAETLDRNLRQLTTETGTPPVAIVGVLGATRAKPLLEVVCRYVRELRLVVPRQGRACRYEQLESLVPASFHGPVVRTTVEAEFPADGRAVTPPENGPIVVTGSIYLAGEVLARIEPSRGPLEHDLQDF